MSSQNNPCYCDIIVLQSYAKGDEEMPKIIPIRELRDTNAISEMCHSSEEPVFITKNGYGDMVIMSLETFEKNPGMSDFYSDVKFSKGKYSDLRQKKGIL
jgi:hypothetical protein